VNQTERRKVARGAARAQLKKFGAVATASEALACLDDLARTEPGLVASQWYWQAGENQIKLFAREWNNDRNTERYTCRYCNKNFPRFYWGISGKAGGLGTVKHRGIARANFERHVKKCRPE